MMSSTSALLRLAVQRLMSCFIAILMVCFLHYDLSRFLLGHYTCLVLSCVIISTRLLYRGCLAWLILTQLKRCLHRMLTHYPNFGVAHFFAKTPVSPVGQWCQQEESNPRPSHYECAALPTELCWQSVAHYKPCGYKILQRLSF